MQTPFIPLVVEDEAVELQAAECPVCGGDGFLVNDDEAEIQCESCGGTGHVLPDEPAL